eukprot:418837-Alexandrium_andersonii.AAC.1
MSASLVGSEMCIRDSAVQQYVQRAAFRAALRRAGAQTSVSEDPVPFSAIAGGPGDQGDRPALDAPAASEPAAEGAALP